MGTSFIKYKNKGRWASDSASTVWLRFLAQEAERTPNAPAWLLRLAHLWHEQATIGVCFNAYLSEVETEEQKETVILLVENTLRHLDEYGAHIPEEVLNGLALGGGIFMRDVKTEVFKRVGRFFVKLLRGEVTTDASYPQPVDVVE